MTSPQTETTTCLAPVATMSTTISTSDHISFNPQGEPLNDLDFTTGLPIPHDSVSFSSDSKQNDTKMGTIVDEEIDGADSVGSRKPSLVVQEQINNLKKASTSPPASASLDFIPASAAAAKAEVTLTADPLDIEGFHSGTMNPNIGNPVTSYNFDMGLDPALNPATNLDHEYWRTIVPEMPTTQVNGYAKLQFDDSSFYITTLKVILGRDQDSYKNFTKYMGELLQQEATTPGKKPRPTTLQCNNFLSGILNPWTQRQDSPQSWTKRKKNSRASRSENASSHSVSRRNSLSAPSPLATNNRPVVDPTTQNPPPDKCPLVSIHPPFNLGLKGYKGISREHAEIYYDLQEECWRVKALGRNGLFVDSQEGSNFINNQLEARLNSGDRLTIGHVSCTFILPDVLLDENGDEEDEEDDDVYFGESGMEMKLGFDEDVELVDSSSSPNPDKETDDTSDNDADSGEEDDSSGGEGDDNAREEEVGGEDVEEEEGNMVTSPSGTRSKLEKKRGPGRPPKNGVMSKREQQLAKKNALEEEKEKAQEKISQAAAVAKKGVGRPRKNPLPEPTEEPRQKRKYTKRQPKERKPENPKSPRADEDLEDDKFTADGELIQSKKGKTKTTYVLKEIPWKSADQCTHEQLQKPAKNYVQMVWEILTEEGIDLCLPQIYNEMEVRYPYFYFCKSKGWQSSVRHNLGQHDCFQRKVRAGKGWAWSKAPGGMYQKEKKKKEDTPAPVQANRTIYGAPPHDMVPPPGYMLDPRVYGHPPAPGQPYMGPPPPVPYDPAIHGPYVPPHPFQGYPPPPMNGHGGPPQGGPLPPFVAPIPPQLNPTGPISYNSPYGPKATSAAQPPQGVPQQQQPYPQQHPPQPQGVPQQQSYPQQSAQQYPQQQPQPHPQQQPHHYQPQVPQGPHQQSQPPQYQSQYPAQPPPQPQHYPTQPPAAPPVNHPPSNQTLGSPQVAIQVQPSISSSEERRRQRGFATLKKFRSILVNALRAQHEDGEELVDAAMARVYNDTDHHADVEERQKNIIVGFRDFLKSKPDLFPNGASEFRPQSPTNHVRTQDNTSISAAQPPPRTTGPDGSPQIPTPNSMRPSLTGPSQMQNANRVGPGAVPRPPLMTPVRRTNSNADNLGGLRANTPNANAAGGIGNSEAGESTSLLTTSGTMHDNSGDGAVTAIGMTTAGGAGKRTREDQDDGETSPVRRRRLDDKTVVNTVATSSGTGTGITNLKGPLPDAGFIRSFPPPQPQVST